jgi:serine-type D-Ala-D-Ala carboxypeptidase (penicillin-binding protein 5/6)
MAVTKRFFKNGIIFLASSLLVFGGGTSLFSQPALAPESGARVEGLQIIFDPRGAPLAENVILPPLQTADLDLTGLTARSYLIYDQSSRTTLIEQSANSPVAIASLTKLLTALVVYENVNLNDSIIITEADIFTVRPVLGLEVSEKVKYIDLFNAMLIGSANDAALALANHVSAQAGKPFSQLMNERAKSLGMTDSHFSNALGFDSEQNYSTARDLQKLIAEVENHTAFAILGRKTSYQFADEAGKLFSIKASNRLLSRDSEIQAIKTGSTPEAQGAMITQINHEGHSFIIIVLQSDNREQDTLKLKQSVIRSFSWPATPSDS